MLALLGMLAVVAIVYGPGLGGGYAFDDYPNIVDNVALHVSFESSAHDWIRAVFSSPASYLQRPIAMLTFALNHAFSGLDPGPMKATNLVIHLFNTLLVFGLIRQLLSVLSGATSRDTTLEGWIALWVAAAWALNPINLTGVLFIVQRMEALCHTFVFAGLWLYLLGRQELMRSGKGWMTLLAGLLGGTLLGLMAKESAILLPLYSFLIECCLLRFRTEGDRHDRRIVALFISVLVLPGLLGTAWLSHKFATTDWYSFRPFTLSERLLTEGRIVVDYLRWTLLPNVGELGLYHDDYLISHSLLAPASTLVALAILTGLATAGWCMRRRRPLTALGLLWFLGGHLLTGTILPLELVFEHRNYFPSLGLCLVLADGILRSKVMSRRRVSVAIGSLLLMFYGAMTYLRASEWSDPVRFSITEAAKRPDSPRATYDLARTLIVLSNYDPNSPYVPGALEALTQARSVAGANIPADQASIIFASRLGRPVAPDVWASLAEKMGHRRIGPQETAALAALVDCGVQRKCQLPERSMLAVFAAALGQGPDPEVLNIYGNYALNCLDDPVLALRLWEDALALEPGEPQYLVNLAKLEIALGHFASASQRIVALRRSGLFGRHESEARSLEDLLDRSKGNVE